jgi:2-hydroxychromene-2-carboxylate isomerase
MSPMAPGAPAATPIEERQRKERTEIGAETAGMTLAFNALQPLGDEARYRAVIWLAQALDLPSPYRAIARRQNEDVPF